jgi:hypothetical protein
MALQSTRAKIDVRFSELEGKIPDEVERWLEARLSGLEPSGEPMPWPENTK